MNTYLFTYVFEDAKWEVSMNAATMEEATRRMSALKRTVEYTGELKLTISLPSWWGRALLWLHGIK